MALILTRAKRTLGAFILSALLYLFPSLNSGCNVQDTTDGGDKAGDVYNGGDAAEADGGAQDFGNQCGAYGPKPCEDDQECIDDYGDGWYCDTGHQIDMCGTPATWPTCIQGTARDAGPFDAGYEDYGGQCVAYGPQPCDTDQECVDQYGAGWYCDKDVVVCGQSWPVCTQGNAKDGGPYDGGTEDFGIPCGAYGPPPCQSDQECIDEHGAGWYCDKDYVAGYCNGQPMTWPTCVEGTAPDAGPADYGSPCTVYGPPPCSTDQDCVDQHGAGWYCDKNAGPCGAACVPGGDK